MINDCVVIDCPNKTHGTYCDEHKYLRDRDRSKNRVKEPGRNLSTGLYSKVNLVEKVCERCGKKFMANKIRTYCSQKCARRIFSRGH